MEGKKKIFKIHQIASVITVALQFMVVVVDGMNLINYYATAARCSVKNIFQRSKQARERSKMC